MMFFRKRLLFGCNQCGECCKQVQVPLCHQDLLRLKAHFAEQDCSHWLQLHPIEATHPEAVMIEQRPVLLTLRTSLPEGGCRMLLDNRCSIYQQRPIVCKTFPFSQRGRRLQISPEFELLVSLACDKTPFSGEAAVRADIQLSDQLFLRYRALVRQWNQETSSHPQQQTLEQFFDFLRLANGV